MHILLETHSKRQWVSYRPLASRMHNSEKHKKCVCVCVYDSVDPVDPEISVKNLHKYYSHWYDTLILDLVWTVFTVICFDGRLTVVTFLPVSLKQNEVNCKYVAITCNIVFNNTGNHRGYVRICREVWLVILQSCWHLVSFAIMSRADRIQRMWCTNRIHNTNLKI